MGTAAFLIGVVAQWLVMGGGRLRRSDALVLLGALCVGTIGFMVGIPAGWWGMPAAATHAQLAGGAATLAAVGGSFVVSLALRERILPFVNAAVVAYLALIYAPLCWSWISSVPFDPRAFVLFGLLCAVAARTGWLAMTRVRPTAIEQLLLYLAYLVLVVLLAFSLPARAGAVFFDAAAPGAPLATALGTGACVGFVSVHAAILLTLVGIQVRVVPDEVRSSVWTAFGRAFERQFLEHSFHPLASELTLVTLGIVLLLSGAWSHAEAAETARTALALLPLAATRLLPPRDVTSELEREARGALPRSRDVVRPPAPARGEDAARPGAPARARHLGKRGRRGW
jgi:hypothetical protein